METRPARRWCSASDGRGTVRRLLTLRNIVFSSLHFVLGCHKAAGGPAALGLAVIAESPSARSRPRETLDSRTGSNPGRIRSAHTSCMCRHPLRDAFHRVLHRLRETPTGSETDGFSCSAGTSYEVRDAPCEPDP